MTWDECLGSRGCGWESPDFETIRQLARQSAHTERGAKNLIGEFSGNRFREEPQ
jgi:hypothetical protein